MNQKLSFQISFSQSVGIFSTIAKIILWIAALWLWANLLESTPDIVDMAILGITAIPALILFWRKPQYGIIALMFFTSGFLAPNVVDIRLPLVGGFELRDILVLTMFGFTLLKGLARNNLSIPWWPVGGLLLAFMLMMVFSVCFALFSENTPFNWALSDARILFFYSIFFITAWNIKSKESLYTLVIGSFVIADITAAIVLIQQRLGAYNYFLPSMNDSSWQVWEVAGATRVVPPGIVFMYFMMLISLGLTIFWHIDLKKTLFWIFHSCFLSFGLLFTFTRSAWVATAIALVLLVILLIPTYKAYLWRMVVLSTATVMFLVGLIGLAIDETALENKAVAGIVERFMSIFTVEDTLETNSLLWRAFENQEAWKSIWKRPITGVGLGGSYRPVTVFQGEAQGAWTDDNISYKRIDRFTRYVHSSYFAITVKMGIPALLIFLSFLLAAVVKSIELHRYLPDSMAKGLTIAIAVGIVGLMQWSLLHAHLILASSTAVIGLMLGIVASIHYLYVSHPQNYTIF